MKHLIILLALCALHGTATVDDDGKADFDNIQAAVDAASDGDEIIVMPGIYTGSGNAQVISIDAKNILLHSSDGPEVTLIDGENIPLQRGIWGRTVGDTGGLYLEGFTIRNCVYDNDSNVGGAGLSWEGGQVTLTNCVFSNNICVDDTGQVRGGGAAIVDADVYILNCTFEGNTVEADTSGAGAHGGGLYLGSCNTDITNTVFSGNAANHIKAVNANSGGGGISTHGSSSATDSYCNLTNCTLLDNYTNGWCGGISSGNSQLTLDSCSFNNNEGLMGGGFYLQGSISVATLNDCTFEDNYVSGWWGGDEISGYHSRGAGVMINAGAQCYLNNCTFTNNASPEGFGGGVAFWGQVEFGDFGGGLSASMCTFTNNSSTSGGGVWTDLLGEGVAEVIVSDSGFECNHPDEIAGVYTDGGGNFIVKCPLECPDTNGDGMVDITDILAVIDQWGVAGGPSDVNGDGIVDLGDLLEIIGNWGPCE